jgi:hypothetical protein
MPFQRLMHSLVGWEGQRPSSVYQDLYSSRHRCRCNVEADIWRNISPLVTVATRATGRRRWTFFCRVPASGKVQLSVRYRSG